MDHSRPLPAGLTRYSDTAIDGLLHGIVSGIPMAAYLALASWLSGLDLGQLLASQAPSTSGDPVLGAITHLAVSGIYGLLFGLAVGALRARSPSIGVFVTAGLAYGIGLWALAHLVLLPATGSGLIKLPSIHIGLAHGMYGLGLGLLAGRAAHRPENRPG